MPQRFRTKPREIEAVRLSWATWNDVVDFVTDGPDDKISAWGISENEASDTCGEPGPEYIAFGVVTTHGEKAIVRHGDWIIPDSKPGTFYPCKPNVFEATYEPIDDLTNMFVDVAKDAYKSIGTSNE